MKTTLQFIGALFAGAMLLSVTPGCKAIKTDNGKHKGWFKNTNNPHHPLTTNPGHASKGKGKKK
jgi:glycerol uptake facilitator-like aquaporin